MPLRESRMTSSPTCPVCHRALPADAPRGICPRCLLAAALAAPADIINAESSGAEPESKHLSISPQLSAKMFGDFELLEEIAQGGMGIVYRARQVSLDRIVALKMLLFGRFTNPKFVERFRAEARAAARLRHPHIVAIHEVGEVDSQPYFSMEYVPGKNLAELVRDQPLPARRAASYLTTIAEAIHYAHQNGIIHRDLKPSNILIDSEDQPHVTDFGLAKQLSGDSDLTLSGQMLGSPNYMPPEQVSGKKLSAPTSDIYSLGAILYHLLTGRPPFLAESLQSTLLQVTQHEPASPRILQPTVPKDLETICLKCLEKAPGRRYQTAEELADEFGRFLSNEPVHARPVTRAERAWRSCRRKPALASFIAATGLLLLTVIIGSPIFTYRINQTRKAEQIQLRRAEAEELTARQNQYASDMFRAHAAINQGDLFSSLRLLDRNRPNSKSESRTTKSEMDLRSWEWRYLWQQCQGDELFILGYHSNGVSTVGFLPDGKTAYSAGKDKAVRLWDLESRRQVGLFTHDNPVITAACSPDGHWLAASTAKREMDYGSLQLWDLVTHDFVVLATNFWFRPNSTVFSPDGQLLAFADVYSGIHLFSVATRHEAARIPAYFRRTDALGFAFSPDGQTLAYNTDQYGEIALWDMPKRQTRESRLKGHTLFVPALAFTPDGRILVSDSMDRTIRLWDVAEGRERTAFTNYPAGVASLRISPDGKRLAIAATPGWQQIILLDTLTGTITGQLRGHTTSLTDAKFSPDGRRLISGSWDGTVRVWDVTARVRQPDSRKFPRGIDEFSGGSGNALMLSPDGRHLLTVFTDKTFSVYDVATLTESAHHALPVNSFSCGALASGGNVSAFVAKDGNVVFWRADTAQTNWLARPVTNSSNRAAFSPDGAQLAIASRREICITDVAAKTKLHRFPFNQHLDVMCLTFSRDGQRLMAGLDDGQVKVWNLAARGQEMTLTGDGEQVRGLALLPDGHTLVSAARDIRFWDLNSGRQLVFKPRATAFYGCSVSTDGRRLAIGAADRRITIWDLLSRQEVAILEGHEERVDDVCFLPDGNTLEIG